MFCCVPFLLQIPVRRVLMAKYVYNLLLWCVTMILLIAVFRQTLPASQDVRRLSTSFTIQYSSMIRTAEESLYDMYGEGNFNDSDQHLLNYIRSMTSQQGPGGRHLSRKSKVDFSQVGGSQFVDQLLKQRRNGFFVECGAFGGEELSDTLFFELQRNWTGLLIEAHPWYHREILRKNRHALVLRACLSANPHPGMVKFKLAGWGSGESALNRNAYAVRKTTPETDVQCFTLNSIMAAFGVRHIDFMVLDVEGSELPILETIDWTRLSVDVFSIEYTDRDRVAKLNRIRHFFSQRGNYKEVGRLPLGKAENVFQDVIFMRV